MSRTVEVAPERLERWIENFGTRHGGITHRDAYLCVGADGARATFEGFDPPRLAVVLVRRGGYAVGYVEGDDLLRHHCGTRRVQSRTAAGGWSQQRYARRRANQADELVDAVVGHLVRVVAELPLRGSRDSLPADVVAGVVMGGDRGLASEVLADPRLRVLESLPRRDLWDIPDPRLEVLRDAVRRARAWHVTISEP